MMFRVFLLVNTGRKTTLISLGPKKWGHATIADHMRAELVEGALINATETMVIEAGAIFHSDRGSGYNSDHYRSSVTRLGTLSSMSKTGECWDYALAESFFSALKNDRVHRTVYATKSQAKRDVSADIEGFDNSRRRNSTLGYRRPNDIHYAYPKQVLAA